MQNKYSILLHYSEIALKLNNRSFFEKIFIKNIKNHVFDLKYSKIKLIAARVIIENIDINQWQEYSIRLKSIMGLQNATLVLEVESKLDQINAASKILIDKLDFKSFRITSKRNDKTFQHTSNDVNVKVGEYVQKLTNKPVNLNFPDINIIIEILKNVTFVGIDRILGFSGLPAKSQEKGLSLISSGIDSPVASFEMIKRGVDLDFIHFHSYPAINKQSINNVKKIINCLTDYQLSARLYLVPLLNIQQKIMELIPDKYWVIFFRRYMIYISNIMAKKINAVALVTGDSIGQVASQTLSNIRAISEVSEYPILRPLSGMNKNDIINRAKNINTYNISILPYEDCCSFFVPPHPETKAKIDQIHKLDKNIKINALVKEAIEKTEIIDFKFGG